MFKKIGVLMSLCSASMTFGNEGGYLFYINNLSDKEAVVVGLQSMNGHKLESNNSLYSISGEGRFSIKKDKKELRVETKKYSSDETPSTFLYPEISGDIGMPWKLVSNGRGTYSLLLADEVKAIEKEEEDQKKQVQEIGMGYEHIKVQSFDDN